MLRKKRKKAGAEQISAKLSPSWGLTKLM